MGNDSNNTASDSSRPYVANEQCNCIITAPTYPVYRSTRHLPKCRFYAAEIAQGAATQTLDAESLSTFTSGPWKASGNGVHKGTNCIAIAFDPDPRESAVTEVTEANARLIAASPDLLEACEFVKRFFNKLEDSGDPGDPLTQARRRYHAPIHAKLDAAIVKAKGGTQQQSS